MLTRADMAANTLTGNYRRMEGFDDIGNLLADKLPALAGFAWSIQAVHVGVIQSACVAAFAIDLLVRVAFRVFVSDFLAHVVLSLPMCILM